MSENNYISLSFSHSNEYRDIEGTENVSIEEKEWRDDHRKQIIDSISYFLKEEIGLNFSYDDNKFEIMGNDWAKFCELVNRIKNTLHINHPDFIFWVNYTGPENAVTFKVSRNVFKNEKY